MLRTAFIVVLVCGVSDAQPCNPGVPAFGDSRTAGTGSGETVWTAQVAATTIINLAISGYVWSQCTARYDSYAGRVRLGTAMQCGVNDILNGGDGHTLWATEKTWAEGQASPSNVIYLFNIPGFKTYDGTGSKLTARNNFNADFAAYCASPAAYVRCIDIATPLWDPADHDKLLAANTIDGLHYTTAGHAIVAASFTASFH